MLFNRNSKRWRSIGVLSLLSTLGAIGFWACWPKLAEPLCKLETFASTYSLQTLGYPAIAEGSVIVLGTERVDVAKACGSSGIVALIFAMSVAVATFVKRPAWERGLIVVSSLPISAMCNAARVTVMAAMVHQVVDDLAGWLMMPLALSMFGIELWILSRLLIAPPDRDVVPVGSRRAMSHGSRSQARQSLGTTRDNYPSSGELGYELVTQR